MDFFEEWEEASWHFTYGDEDQPEKTVLQGGLVIVLYMVKSYLQGNRIALADTMLRLQQIMGEHLQWGYWEHPNNEKKYTRERFAQCVEWVRQQTPLDAVEFAWSSGPGYDFVGDYGVRVFSQRSLEEEGWKVLSHFQIYLPVEILRGDGRKGFEALVTELASRLPVLHGYAGLGFQQCEEFHRYEYAELEHAEQFSGFEVANLLGHPELSDGIKSVNWYTILDQSWLEKLGGRIGLERAVQEEASKGLSLLDYTGGVIVKAGEWPSLGWDERDPMPAAYVAANHILKPVRVPKLRGLHMGSVMSETRFNDELTDRWLRRFDEPGIWPPRALRIVPEVKEKAEPAQPASPRVLRASPGEPCPHEGAWFSPFIQSGPVQIKLGEPMPGPEFTSLGQVTWYLRLAD